MDLKSRRIATSVLWIAAFITTIIMHDSSVSYGIPPIIPAFGTAILTTIFLWWNEIVRRLLGTQINTQYHTSSNHDIVSRAYKLAILLEVMDQDEREEFKYQLKNDLLSSDDSRSVEAFLSEKRKRYDV